MRFGLLSFSDSHLYIIRDSAIVTLEILRFGLLFSDSVVHLELEDLCVRCRDYDLANMFELVEVEYCGGLQMITISY